MKLKLIIFTLFLLTMQTTTIIKFDKSTDISGWSVVDDGVMGGRSAGKFHLNNEGNAVFEGRVSLENNGGFSSVRYGFEEIRTKGFTKVLLKVKGDGKTYQFRVKHKTKDYYSYIVNFQPSEEWGTIELTLSEMHPAVKHGDPLKPIQTNVTAENGQFKLSVLNAGEKIPEEKMLSLFKPFFSTNSENNKSGLGLGLYISSEIAKAHGGKMKVRSLEDEIKFTFCMPTKVVADLN